MRVGASLSRNLAASLVLAAAFHGNTYAQSSVQTTGPYKAVMEMAPSLQKHTVYRPENLAAVRGKLPLLAWGNGACASVGNSFENYLTEIASYGFLAIASGPIDPTFPSAAEMQKMTQAANNPSEPGRSAAPAMRMPTERTTTKQLLEAMDWAKAQNEDKSSPYYGRIDLGAIAVGGQSCGGLEALEAAADPRVKTVVVVNSGIMRNPGAIPAPPGAAPIVIPGSVESLTKLHTPTIYLIGGEKDIAYKNAEADFAAIKNVPLFKANLDVGHGGTLAEPHGGKFAEAATQWLLWQLKHDQQAARMFVGEKCGLCQRPEWKVERKNMK
jgi:dienelactone hydrolase